MKTSLKVTGKQREQRGEELSHPDFSSMSWLSMHLTAERREKVKTKVYHKKFPYTRDSISLHDDANAHSEFNSNQAVGLSLRFYQFLQSLSSRCVHWPVTGKHPVSLPLSFQMHDFVKVLWLSYFIVLIYRISQVSICIYCADSVSHMGILMWIFDLQFK